MIIPKYIKHSVCDICGKLCVPMSKGDHWYDYHTDSYITVAVCLRCNKELGEDAFEKACSNKRYKRKDEVA